LKPEVRRHSPKIVHVIEKRSKVIEKRSKVNRKEVR
jgi:hypothetical protein